MAQFLPPFVEGTILLLGALGAGALGRQLQQDTEKLLRERQKPGAKQMQQTPPPPPMPEVEPPKMSEKTEFPAEPPDIPELPGFSMPEDRPNLIEIFPDMSGEFPQITILENRGGPRTQELNADIADLGRAINKEQGGSIDHVGGTFNDKRKKVKETHLKGPDDAKPLRKGSFVDVTFQSRDTERRLLINTIDTKADRVTPSKREAEAAIRIIANKNSGDILVLIGKLRNDEALDMKDIKKFLRPLFEEIARPADENTIENLPRLWNPEAR